MLNTCGFIIKNSTISIDYWNKQELKISHRFLTNAGSKNTAGLNSNWDQEMIYCTLVMILFLF